MSSLIYLPEMGEVPDLTVLFQTQHNFRDSYSIQWLASRDAEAQAAFKRLGIRPRSITPHNSASYSTALEGDIFSGLITSRGEDKLSQAGLRCLKMLLD